MKTSRVKSSATTDGKALTMAQFASDTLADGSVTRIGGLQKGSIYYNTTTNKLKVKENTTWKTITTS